MVFGDVVATLVRQSGQESDTSAVVREAQDKLRRAAQIANLGSDPLGTVIEAQVSMLGAMQAMFAAARVSTGSQTDGGVATLEIIRAADRLLARRQRAFQVKTVLIAVAAASLVAGVLVLWMQPGASVCQDVRGGRFCGQWVIPPDQ